MITIYYGSIDNRIQFAEPVNIIKNYTKKQKRLFAQCPAWRDVYKNVFGVKSTQSFTMTVKDGHFKSEQPQKWFDKNILVREKDMFSFEHTAYFFTLEKSLLLEQKAPVLENNDIKNKAHLVEGVFDMGKWIRPLECSVVVNKDDTLKVDEEDIIYYIKFHTKEKIKFKKFLVTPKLAELLPLCASIRKDGDLKVFKPLSYFYNLINAQRFKKIIYKEIKKNLI